MYSASAADALDIDFWWASSSDSDFVRDAGAVDGILRVFLRALLVITIIISITSINVITTIMHRLRCSLSVLLFCRCGRDVGGGDLVEWCGVCCYRSMLPHVGDALTGFQQPQFSCVSDSIPKLQLNHICGLGPKVTSLASRDTDLRAR